MGAGRATMANTPDGPKWTARSASRCRDRWLGEAGGGLQSAAPDGLRTARSSDGLWGWGREKG